MPQSAAQSFDDSNLPLVSVYLPTRNRAKLLHRAIHSVLAQTYPNIELIVVDDASEDDTRARIRAHPHREQFVFLEQPRCLGACAARNRAIDVARGELITGMDDDDAFCPERISTLQRSFRDGSWSCVASCIVERTPHGDITRRVDYGVITLEDMLHYNRLGNQVLTRTSYLRAIGGFDPALPALQDYDTWLRLIAAFGNAFKMKEASYIQFKDYHGERISANRPVLIQAFDLFVAKHRDLLAKRHHASLEILRRRLAREPLGPIDFIRLVNRGNIKAALPMLINTTPALSVFKHLLRMRYRTAINT